MARPGEQDPPGESRRPDDTGALSGATAVVTGASRGIGQATARELARRGANVVLAARTTGALEGIAGEIRAAGGTAAALACDVTDYAQVEAVARLAVERFGSLDVLVNNAGVIEPIAPLEETDPGAWSRAVSANLVGAFHGCRAVAAHMLARGSGVIVNVSSGAALRPLEGWSAYCASKAGLAMLTRSLALELGPRGVRAYGFQPGVVDTAMQGAIRASGLNEVSRLPRERLASPGDPARAIAWLCTLEAADLAGQELSIRDPAFRRRAGLDDG